LHRICREPHRPIWRSNKDLPDELSDVIDQLLEKKPARRLGSAEAVREELASLLSRAQQYGLGQRHFAGIRGKRQRHRVFWSATAAFLLAAMVIGAVATSSQWWPRATKEQPVQTETGGKVTVQSEHMFVGDWAETQNAVGQLERTTSFVESDDPWNREVESLQHSLSELEARENPTAVTKGARK
jgi:eukaryotic-like serine/threonine-protein kinase